jgi:two-component system, NtrC family, C4-dicarboxylate transport response regulator DctD
MTSQPLNLVAFIDDDPDVRAATAQALRLAGIQARVFASAEQALRVIGLDFPGVVVSDVRMPQIDGLEFHQKLKALDPDLPVVLVTGHGNIEDAVRAIKAGAFDFITKPFATDRLLIGIRRALSYRALALENRSLMAAAAASDLDLPILGVAPAIIALRATIRQLAETETNILIEGETGVGKEHIARVLHQASRKQGFFSMVDCAYTPDAQINEELYGIAPKGPGLKARRGRFEAANGGTVFLHDIDHASPALQTALARVLEDRAIPLADGTDLCPVAFRAIGSSSRDLESHMASGGFRQDLYYGLSMIRIRVPPLRERRCDIPVLFAAFQADAARRLHRPIPTMTDEVRQRLIDHNWPGNIRELQHFAQRVVFGQEAPERGQRDVEILTLGERVNRFEATVLRETLRATSGDVRSTLAALKIPRKTFYDKLARHQIDIDAYRTGESPGPEVSDP